MTVQKTPGRVALATSPRLDRRRTGAAAIVVCLIAILLLGAITSSDAGAVDDRSLTTTTGNLGVSSTPTPDPEPTPPVRLVYGLVGSGCHISTASADIYIGCAADDQATEPLTPIQGGPLLGTEQELEDYAPDVERNRNDAVDRLKQKEEDLDMHEEDLNEFHRWLREVRENGPPPVEEDIDDFDCSRPEHGYYPQCYPECGDSGARDPYSPNYIPECNPDCYGNWVAGTYIQGFAAGADEECSRHWNPLDCGQILSRITILDRFGFVEPPITNDEWTVWLTCANNPEFGQQPEPKPLDTSGLCISLPMSANFYVSLYNWVDHNTWENNPKSTPRVRDKLFNNLPQPELGGIAGIESGLDTEFEKVAIAIRSLSFMDFAETVELVEILNRYNEGDPVVIAAMQQHVSADLLQQHGGGNISALDTFVQRWTREGVETTMNGSGLPAYTVGPLGTINETTTSVRDWPAVLRGMCQYGKEMDALEKVADQVNSQSSTSFTLRTWTEGMTATTGTKVWFSVTNNSASSALNLSDFSSEVSGWDTSAYNCNPAASSDAAVAELSIGAGQKVTCHLVLKERAALIAHYQPDAEMQDAIPTANDAGPFGSLTVTGRAGGQEQRALATWGQTPIFNVGESGTGNGAFTVTGVGPLPHGFTLRHEDGWDILGNSRFNRIIGDGLSWEIQIDVTWNPNGRTSESFELVERRGQQDGRSIWISIRYPKQHDTIYHPNVRLLTRNDVVSISDYSINPGPPALPTTHLQINLRDQIENGDILVLAGHPDRPEGLLHRASSVPPNGGTLAQLTDGVDLHELYRQVDIETEERVARPFETSVAPGVSLPTGVNASVSVSTEGSADYFVFNKVHIDNFWQPVIREVRQWQDYQFSGTGRIKVDGGANFSTAGLETIGIPMKFVPELSRPAFVPVWPDPPIVISVNSSIEMDLSLSISSSFESDFRYSASVGNVSHLNPQTGEWSWQDWSWATPSFELSDLKYSGDSFVFDVHAEMETDISTPGLWKIIEGTFGAGYGFTATGDRPSAGTGTIVFTGAPRVEVGTELLQGLGVVSNVAGTWWEKLVTTILDLEYNLGDLASDRITWDIGSVDWTHEESQTNETASSRSTDYGYGTGYSFDDPVTIKRIRLDPKDADLTGIWVRSSTGDEYASFYRENGTVVLDSTLYGVTYMFLYSEEAGRTLWVTP